MLFILIHYIRISLFSLRNVIIVLLCIKIQKIPTVKAHLSPLTSLYFMVYICITHHILKTVNAITFILNNCL